mgnify:CR=1 FL=1
MATIKDVAKHADVSIATVSRIINNRGPISEKTRNRVYESMKALNYQPNEMARALQKQKSNIIGLIVPSIEYDFFSRLIEAVEETCHEHGYKLMLGRSGENEDREIEMVSMLEGNKVDGILLCSRLGDAGIYRDRATMPIVSIDRDIDGFSTVTSDNYQGGVLAADELYAAGSRRPVLFGNRTPEYMTMNARNRGFFDECGKLGMEPRHIPASISNDDTALAVRSFLCGLEKYPDADGVFITGDVLASQIVCSQTVRKMGIFKKMPVISYDGLNISGLLGISTIAQPIREMGKTAAEQLIQEIECRSEDKESHTRFVLPVCFIERDSTARFKRVDEEMDFERLTAYIDSLKEEYGIPAADCKITKDHKVVYRHMMGCSDYENKTPLNEETIFRFFSATKVVTMTAVMQQIERGKLRLYDEVRQYLPEYNMMKVADTFNFTFPLKWPTSSDPCHYAHNAIRIIDLMTMTAGLSYDTDSKEEKEIREKSNNQASTREVVAELAKMPLVYEPGTRYSYGLCHDVLAAVVEVVSGQKYSEYLKENIFDPLGIKDLYFHWDRDPKLNERVCALYQGVFGTDDIIPDTGEMTSGFKITANYESGGAGLAGTVDAYSILIDALCNGGVGANGARILSEESVKMFSVPYTTGQMSRDFAVTGKVGYEYGLGVRVLMDDRDSRSPVGEFGWDGAAGAYVLVDPVNHISIFYTQHIAGYPRVYSEIHPRIRDIAYECMGY